jgi:hypothetical protein
MHDARFMTMFLAAIAASDRLHAGDAAVCRRRPRQAHESGRQRARADPAARARPARQNRKVSLRQSPKQLISKVVEDFNLTKWLAQEAARDKLVMAGYRGQAPYVTFVFARAVTPIVLFHRRVLYVFVSRTWKNRCRSSSASASAPPISGSRPDDFPEERDPSASSRSSAPFPTRSICS